jgi:hypothetical protein
MKIGLPSTTRTLSAHAPAEAGVDPLTGPFLDFFDLWGNRIEIVSYGNVHFTKGPNVLRGMGLPHNRGTQRQGVWRRAEGRSSYGDRVRAIDTNVSSAPQHAQAVTGYAGWRAGAAAANESTGFEGIRSWRH